MGSHGIKDRFAIVGMGCTNFVEHWDKGLDDLVIEGANEAYASAGVDKDDVDAYWLGTAQGGMSGITLARPLQLVDRPVTRVENFCATGALHLPPTRISREGDAQDEMDPAPMSEVQGTIATFTIDRIAYSPSPPIVFAVVDFDGGGRLPVELCDLDASQIKMGDRVERPFRKLFTSDGIHNYFWKARPVRD